jgi:alpha-mannosidase
MSLIRSVPHPGAALIGKDDKADTSVAAVYGDLGTHTFTYTLQPHAGPADLAKLTAGARALNTPLAVIDPRAPATLSPNLNTTRAPLFTFGSPSIELAAIKPADDGNGWVLRLVNVEGRAVTAQLSNALPDVTWTECDLMERALTSAESQSKASAGPHHGIYLSPFEIRTLRIGKPQSILL